ncbi:hypothetical protein [uncultured Clostridium sp.]|uniref:hypothetical protein n=1 Tax=uncultured Clostridium sp. TaxID=59620 RepID=UPI0026EF3DDF|nr:hypothetical protein [uncultured Clostridium sp.]
MKKQDLEAGIEDLKEIRNIASKQDYNTSVAINKKLLKILPLLENEYNRMTKENVNVESPLYKEITIRDCDDLHVTMEEYINNYIAELAENDYSILDYGIIYVDQYVKYGYVKYYRK